MVSINKNIRFYQPNDPYYWEVDNLPLSDLLSNDIVLEERIQSIEDVLNGLGSNAKGSFSLEAISDLKAYTESPSGSPSNFGKVFVRPGKFVARIQVPATRESGWRMMRDRDDYFNNTNFDGIGGLNSTSVSDDFIRTTKGLSRTAIVEFYPNADGSDKYVSVESFDSADFNSESPPIERLDLVYIKGSQSLDSDLTQSGIPEASLGIIKGAYFRTDDAGGTRTNGPRFENPESRLFGKTTGMSQTEIPADSRLSDFGTIPMPEDIINFAWHKTELADEIEKLVDQQISTQASFVIPIAYVRVPLGFVKGRPIEQSQLIDIRPFLRSAEFTYGERAAIAAAVSPNGNNPFVTDSHLREVTTPLESDVQVLTTKVESNSGRIDSNAVVLDSHTSSISRFEVDISGTAQSPTPDGLNHEGRIAALESSLGSGNGPLVERHKFLSSPRLVGGGVLQTSELGTAASPKEWDITEFIPANDRANLVAVQFRFQTFGRDGNTDDFTYVYMRGGVQEFRRVSAWSVKQSGGELIINRGNINTFYADVNKILRPNGEWKISFNTYGEGSNDVDHWITVDGYITQE